jgi:hypothetical protein
MARYFWMEKQRVEGEEIRHQFDRRGEWET